MEIPPPATLLNLVNTLPVQGASATPGAARGPKPVAPVTPPPAANEAGQPSGRSAHRGSIINILV